MHSLRAINTFIDYGQAFLAEISVSDSLDCQKVRALQAKRVLENAKLRIDRLLETHPGLTANSPDIKLAIQRYTLYNDQAMAILTQHLGFHKTEMLLKCLSEAETAMAKAIDRIISPQEALNSLDKANKIKLAIERGGEKLPDTIIHRLEGLKGYSARL